MTRETYRGRKLAARKGRDWGTLIVTCNGQPVSWPTSRDERAALDQVKAQIDAIDREPVNGERWGAEWYAPGTFEMCAEGIHPQVIGGPCEHFTCKRKVAADLDRRAAQSAARLARYAHGDVGYRLLG